jgi:hypothetical protein
MTLLIYPVDIYSVYSAAEKKSTRFFGAIRNLGLGSDWTNFDTISAWIYLDDSTLEGPGMIRVSIGYRGQSQDDPGHVRGNSVRIDRNKLNIGWDQLEASFDELLVFQSDGKPTIGGACCQT